MENALQHELVGIYVEEDDLLLSAEFKHCLAKQLIKFKYRNRLLSRQTTVDWLTDVIYDFCNHGGIIYDGDGDEIYIHSDIIDDAYFDDESYSWNSDVRRFARRVPKRRSSDRILLRLQLFDAAFRIIGEPILPTL